MDYLVYETCCKRKMVTKNKLRKPVKKLERNLSFYL